MEAGIAIILSGLCVAFASYYMDNIYGTRKKLLTVKQKQKILSRTRRFFKGLFEGLAALVGLFGVGLILMAVMFILMLVMLMIACMLPFVAIASLFKRRKK